MDTRTAVRELRDAEDQALTAGLTDAQIAAVKRLVRATLRFDTSTDH